MQSATYCKDGAGENKPKQVSHSCLFRPLVKCQTPPRLEEEEATCQSSWRPLSVALTARAPKWISVCMDKGLSPGSPNTSRGTKSFGHVSE